MVMVSIYDLYMVLQYILDTLLDAIFLLRETFDAILSKINLKIKFRRDISPAA